MPSSRARNGLCLLAALALVAGAGFTSPAHAQAGFPKLHVWAFPGAWRDSTLLFPRRCPGTVHGALADSVVPRPRTITVRWLRNRAAELRPDFGGYRLYRVIQTPDTTNMVLLRRYSINAGSEITWNYASIDTGTASPTYMQYLCNGAVTGDSIITFVDPDSSGSYQKVCRRVDHLGRCLTPGDSIFTLVVPAGPHDGFLTWYAVTYEALNQASNDYADLFVPDSSNSYAKCGTPGDPSTCPNANSKSENIIAAPVEPTAGPKPNLTTVAVVPNPYRGTEAWDPAGGSEIHFINLPAHATIKVYTAAGDLVRILHHDDTVRDFERWDLKNANGSAVTSGIYLYRVEAGAFTFQNRLIVIR